VTNFINARNFYRIFNRAKNPVIPNSDSIFQIAFEFFECRGRGFSSKSLNASKIRSNQGWQFPFDCFGDEDGASLDMPASFSSGAELLDRIFQRLHFLIFARHNDGRIQRVLGLFIGWRSMGTR